MVSNDYSKIEIAQTKEQFDFLKGLMYFEATKRDLKIFDNFKKEKVDDESTKS
jgi:hypothetical protein